MDGETWVWHSEPATEVGPDGKEYRIRPGWRPTLMPTIDAPDFIVPEPEARPSPLTSCSWMQKW